jgi:hypothetical protein
MNGQGALVVPEAIIGSHFVIDNVNKLENVTMIKTILSHYRLANNLTCFKKTATSVGFLISNCFFFKLVEFLSTALHNIFSSNFFFLKITLQVHFINNENNSTYYSISYFETSFQWVRSNLQNISFI